MKTRKDIHRPSVIDPSQYEFVAMEYVKLDSFDACDYLTVCRERIKAHMAQTGGTYAHHEHGGNCMVCGASAIYTALFYHALTNTYVRTGQDCAEKMGLGADWDAFRKAVTNAREAFAGKKKAMTLLADQGLSDCWAIYLNPPVFVHPQGLVGYAPGDPLYNEASQDTYWADRREWERQHREEPTVVDIVGKLVKWGSISEASMRYLHVLSKRIAGRAGYLAKRAAEAAAAADCPTGRVEIEGVILSLRVDQSEYGPTTKILVKHDSGYRVWGTRPSAITRSTGYCADVGDRIAFAATVTPSDKDPKFGFYSRPAKGRMVQEAAPKESAA